MPQVTLSLTDRDIENTKFLSEALDARSNAHAVSIALSLTAYLVGKIREGKELCLWTPQGDFSRVVMDELEPAKRHTV